MVGSLAGGGHEVELEERPCRGGLISEFLVGVEAKIPLLAALDCSFVEEGWVLALLTLHTLSPWVGCEVEENTLSWAAATLRQAWKNAIAPVR